LSVSDIGPLVSGETICGFDQGVVPSGKRIVKTEPLPGWLATVTSLPIKVQIKNQAASSSISTRRSGASTMTSWPLWTGSTRQVGSFFNFSSAASKIGWA
jgi:hypothetical protein